MNGLRGLTSGNFEYRIKNHTEWTAQPQGANSIQFASLPNINNNYWCATYV